MFELGKKDEMRGVSLLQPLTINGRPSKMPVMEEGEDVVCGYDQGLGEQMFICNSLEDLQKLYDAYARGGAIKLRWYKTPNVDLHHVHQSDNATFNEGVRKVAKWLTSQFRTGWLVKRLRNGGDNNSESNGNCSYG